MANEGRTYSDGYKEGLLQKRVDGELDRQRADFLQKNVWELETSLARVRGLLQRQWISVEERSPEIYDSAHGDWRESEMVLLWWVSGDYAAGRLCEDEQGTRWWLAGNIDAAPSSVSHWQPIAPPNFLHSSELVSQGAESADIGKLDTREGERMTASHVIIRTKRATPEEVGKILGVPPKRVRWLKMLVTK